MFTLLVGPEELAMTVHEDSLEKSPFFAAVCNSNFREGHSGVIELKEDDPTHLRLLIDFLNCDDFDCGSIGDAKRKKNLVVASAEEMTDDSWPSDPFPDESETTEADEPEPSVSDPAALALLAGIYILAEKYQISRLQVLCLAKMRPCIDLSAHPEAFLQCASIGR